MNSLSTGRSSRNSWCGRRPSPGEIVTRLADDGLLAGIDLARFPSLEMEDGLLIAVTERRTRAQIDRLVEALARFS